VWFNVLVPQKRTEVALSKRNGEIRGYLDGLNEAGTTTPAPMDAAVATTSMPISVDALSTDAAAPSEQQPHPEYLAICCSLESDKAEREGPLVTALMEQLAPQLTAKKSSSGGDDDGATTHVARGIRPLLVSEATKIPLVPLPRGLSGFTASEDTVDTTAAMLEESGICIYPAALTEQDTTALARLAMIRTAQVERALASGVEANPRGTVIGSGDVTFAEICSRGVQRWDMLLHPPGGAISTSSRFLTIWSLDPCFSPDFWADTIHLVGNG
jgi:hypothetical protein